MNSIANKVIGVAERLDWDSEFFGKEIGRIAISKPEEDFLEEKLEEFKSLRFDLVYIFIEGSGVLSDSFCAAHNCRWVDCKVIYSTHIENTDRISSFVSEYEQDASALYELAFQAGTHSRFHTDPGFAGEDFSRLYKMWIDNSLNHSLADKVFIAKTGHGIDGFITVKRDKGVANIGLLAVNTTQRGKGIGAELLVAAKRYAQDTQCPYLRVAAQQVNTKACSFYEKNGFQIESQTNIYHVWLTK